MLGIFCDRSTSDGRRRIASFPTTPFRRSVSRRHLTGIPNLGLWKRGQTSARGSEPCIFGVLSLDGATVQDVFDRQSVETN